MPKTSQQTDIERTLDRRGRDWVCEAVGRIEADFNRSSDTHLIKLELPCLEGVDLYLKDESTHPSGSLKHRLARSLILYGLCNGWIGKDTPIIESSSGSTAISEAYFARLLGLPFIAVVPDTTAREKIAQIEFYGGECRRVAPTQIYDEAARLADRLSGHYADQRGRKDRCFKLKSDPDPDRAEQSQPEHNQYVFAYTVTIRNDGDIPVKLLTRHWIITDGAGKTEEVEGEGVVGQQPELSPGEGFRYTSGAILQTPVGSMHGTYEFQEADGTLFDVPIAAFSLSQPNLVH